MMAPRIAGLRCRQSPSRLVTVMKSEPKKTRSTSGMAKRRVASGERAPAWASGKSTVPAVMTSRPGRNFKVAGLGVVSVCMNMDQISRLVSDYARGNKKRTALRLLFGFSAGGGGGGEAFFVRIDVEIDHADAALLQDRDTFFDRRAHVGGFGDGADADGALGFGHLGDVGQRVLDAQSDPAVRGLAAAPPCDIVLMQLVIEIGAVVVDQDQQRNAMAHGGPDRGRAHAEIAVAEHRDGVAAHVVERERGADRDAGT